MAGESEAAAAFETEMGGAPPETTGGRPEEIGSGRVTDDRDQLPEDADVDEEEDGEEGEPDDEEEEGEGEQKPDEDAHLKGDLGDLDPNKVVKVVVDGKLQDVSLAEMRDGYIRQETFHQRMNGLRDTATALQDVAQSVDTQRAHYIQQIDALNEQLQLLKPEEPNWAAEYARDPAGAQQMQQRWEVYKKGVAQLQQDRQRAIEEMQARQMQEQQTWLQQNQQRMLNDNPEWRDPKVWSRDKSAMERVAMECGFSLEELNGVTDARQMRILKMAAKYAELQRTKPKPDQRIENRQEPRRDQSGRFAAPKAKPRRQGSQAMDRLATSGSLRDATAVFGEILSRE